MILIQLAAAVLLLAPPTNAQQDLQCSAAQDDKEGQVKCILQRVEKETLKFRDEIERAYGLRCNEETLARCRSSNFNDCKSIFPNRQCMKDVLDCGGDCGALLDKTTSSVYIPSAEGDYTETACYTLLAEEYMRTKYEEDEDFWDTYEVKPPWTYFGARNGLFRRLPAIARDKCGSYDFDPRVRPWFVAASSGPKDVVIVLDVSGSMMNSPGRMDLAKEAAIKVVNTLTISDRVAVIVFSETANATQLLAGEDAVVLTDKDTTLIIATDENKKLLEEAIKQISSDKGETNFYAGFQKAFEALNNTDEEDPERISGCNAAILFLTDGKSNVGPDTDEVLDLINDSIQQLAIDTKIFTFSLGIDADQNVTKKIACSTNGIWTHIEDLDGDLVGAMASYYKLYALGLGYNEEFTAWVELYEFVSSKKMGTTNSAPVFDRSVDPPLFLGVVASDIHLEDLNKVFGQDATSSEMLNRFIQLSTAQCPRIDLSESQLDALRGENAECGKSNSTTQIIAAECLLPGDLKDNLWNNTNNTDMEGKEYNVCCEIGSNSPSETCSLSPDPLHPFPVWAIIVIVLAVVVSLLLMICLFLVYRKFRRPKPPALPDDSSSCSLEPTDDYDYVYVVAPPGKLGFLIGDANHGTPIYMVKDSSPIADKIWVGDKLVAVDDQDVRNMTTFEVAELLTDKSENQSRKLTLIRPPPLSLIRPPAPGDSISEAVTEDYDYVKANGNFSVSDAGGTIGSQRINIEV